MDVPDVSANNPVDTPRDFFDMDISGLVAPTYRNATNLNMGVRENGGSPDDNLNFLIVFI